MGSMVEREHRRSPNWKVFLLLILAQGPIVFLLWVMALGATENPDREGVLYASSVAYGLFSLYLWRYAGRLVATLNESVGTFGRYLLLIVCFPLIFGAWLVFAEEMMRFEFRIREEALALAIIGIVTAAVVVQLLDLMNRGALPRGALPFAVFVLPIVAFVGWHGVEDVRKERSVNEAHKNKVAAQQRRIEQARPDHRIEQTLMRITWEQSSQVSDHGKTLLDYSIPRLRERLRSIEDGWGVSLVPSDAAIRGVSDSDGERSLVSVSHGQSEFLLDFVIAESGETIIYQFCRGETCGPIRPSRDGFRTGSSRAKSCKGLDEESDRWCAYDEAKNRTVVRTLPADIKNRYEQLAGDRAPE